MSVVGRDGLAKKPAGSAMGKTEAVVVDAYLIIDDERALRMGNRDLARKTSAHNESRS